MSTKCQFREIFSHQRAQTQGQNQNNAQQDQGDIERCVASWENEHREIFGKRLRH